MTPSVEALAPSPQASTSSPRSEAEWQTRREQAALFRLLDHYGMSDLANQVVGARVAGEPEHYLLCTPTACSTRRSRRPA